MDIATEKTKYDVIIVGAGPAGLFAADTLSSNRYKILIVDKGRDINERICPKEKNSKAVCNCSPCNIYAGLGGAGGRSDGKLNFYPYSGGDLYQFTENPIKYIDAVDAIFTELSGITEYSTKEEDAKRLVYESLKSGLEFVVIKQKHIGSDKLFDVMTRFKERLSSKGVEFKFLTNVDDLAINDNTVHGAILKNHSLENMLSKHVILCPGREGTKWFSEISKKYNLELGFLPIDIGVRVETLDDITNPVTNIQYDPKIRMLYRDALVRNFCTNPQGFVVTENYGEYFLVNGHAEKKRKSANCNFAILYRVNLSNPISNTTEYGMNIAKLFNQLGDKKPIVQRLEDIRLGRRSKSRRLATSSVKPTLKDAVPGDITLAMPEKIMKAILEYIEKLEILMPGINQGNNTLLYAPEIKFQSMRGKVNEHMESSIQNLFLAGDGCGLTGGIVPAAVSGILAAEGIIKKNS